MTAVKLEDARRVISASEKKAREIGATVVFMVYTSPYYGRPRDGTTLCLFCTLVAAAKAPPLVSPRE